VWSSLVPPVPLLGLSLLTESGVGEAFTTLDASGLLALAFVVVASTFAGFGTWTWLLARHPASQVAPFTLLVPVVGIAAAWVALGEVPTAAELAGGAVVPAGLALTVRPPRVRAPLTAPAPNATLA
jgi:O-acetylserine/cysteine efflux transporter